MTMFPCFDAEKLCQGHIQWRRVAAKNGWIFCVFVSSHMWEFSCAIIVTVYIFNSVDIDEVLTCIYLQEFAKVFTCFLLNELDNICVA